MRERGANDRGVFDFCRIATRRRGSRRKGIGAAEAGVALKAIAENFRAHPAFRAKMTVRVTDLIGERVEEGWLAIARPGKVLRRFEKPSSKIWFLDGASCANCHRRKMKSMRRISAPRQSC